MDSIVDRQCDALVRLKPASSFILPIQSILSKKSGFNLKFRFTVYRPSARARPSGLTSDCQADRADVARQVG